MYGCNRPNGPSSCYCGRTIGYEIRPQTISARSLNIHTLSLLIIMIRRRRIRRRRRGRRKQEKKRKGYVVCNLESGIE